MKKILQKIMALPDSLNEQLVQIRSSLTRLNENLEHAVFGKEEKHFVAVYIECVAKETSRVQGPKLDYGFPVTEYGEEPVQKVFRASIGYSATITGSHTFRIQPNQTIKGLRIVVFCDLAKVVVRSMQCANRDLMVANDGTGACPIGYYDGELSPAQVLYIVVDKR